MTEPAAATETTLRWSWDGRSLATPLTWRGEGPTALLLPALSSIATRDEMAPLAASLAGRYRTVAPDWPGFGAGNKPRVDWTPAAMADWLARLLDEVSPELIVAAGHGAGYVLRHYADRPEAAPQVALVAPTWRGPFPTMLGRRPDWLARVRATMDSSVTGPALYAMNLSEPVLGRMARGHVYADPAWLTPERMAEKRAVARAGGARFASVRFVTGALDPFEDAAAARAAAAALPAGRLRMIWGEGAPPKSRAAMADLAAAAGVTPTVLPQGKLGLHEEFPDAVARHLP